MKRGVSNPNPVRKAAALLLCLCILTAQASTFADSEADVGGASPLMEIVSEPVLIPTVAEPSAAPRTTADLLDICVGGGVTVTLRRADGSVVTNTTVLNDGETVDFSIAFEMAESAHNQGQYGNTEFWYELPGNINLGNGLSDASDPRLSWVIERADGKSVLKVDLTDAFFQDTQSNYSVTLTFKATLKRPEGNTDGQETIQFPGSADITVRFDATVDATKECTRNVYEVGGRYFADYAIRITPDTDISEAVVTDTAGEWIKIDAATLAVEPQAGLELVQAPAKDEQAHQYTTKLRLTNLKGRQTYTVSYTAEIAPEQADKELAINRGELGGNVWWPHDDYRRNAAQIEWTAVNGIQGDQRTGTVRVTYDRTSAGASIDKSVASQIIQGSDLSGMTMDVVYHVAFQLDAPMSATVIDAPGDWITNVRDARVYKITNPDSYASLSAVPKDHSGDTEITGQAEVTREGNRTSVVLTDAEAGKYCLVYTATIPNEAFRTAAVQYGDAEKQKTRNIAEITWDGGSQRDEEWIDLWDYGRIYKSGAYEVNGKNQLRQETVDGITYAFIKWSVWFDWHQMDVSGLTLSDTLPAGQTLENASLAVGGTNYILYPSDNGAGFTYENGGFSYIVGSRGEPTNGGKYVLTYTTRVPMNQDGTFPSAQNSVTADGNGYHPDAGAEVPSPSGGKPGLEKALDEGNAQTMIAQWHTDVKIPAGTASLQNVVITDYPDESKWNCGQLSQFMWFINTGDVRVEALNATGEPSGKAYVAGTDYTIQFGKRRAASHDDTQMTITWIGALTTGVRVTYWTYIDAVALRASLNNPDSLTLWNRVTVASSNGDEGYSKDWTIAAGDAPQFKKHGDTSKINESGTVSWVIEAGEDYDRLKGQTIVVKDTLPEGLKLIPDSVKVTIGGRWWPWAALDKDQVTVTVSEENPREFEVSFSTAALLEDRKQHGWFQITYDTQLDKEQLLRPDNGSYTLTLTNRAAILIQDEGGSQTEVGRVQADVNHTVQGGSIIEKGVRQNRDKLLYTIHINQNGLDLDPGHTHLTLSDKLHADLSLRLETVTVAADDGSALTKVSGDAPGLGEYFCTYDPNTRELKIILPDELPCTVTYTAVLNGTVGDHKVISNTATLSGMTDFSDGVTDSFVVQSPATTIVGKTTRLQLEKVDSANSNVKLSGAQFSVYEVLVDETEGGYSFENSAYPAAQGETGEDGTVLLPEIDGLKFDTIYFLQETKAPAGYQASAEQTFFIFYGIDRKNAEAKVAAYQRRYSVTVQDYSDLPLLTRGNARANEVSFAFGKRWDDAGHAQNRPARVIIRLWQGLEGSEAPAVEYVSSQTPMTIDLTAGNAELFDFTVTLTVPARDENGANYVYAVTEEMYDQDGGRLEPLDCGYVSAEAGCVVVNKYLDRKPSLSVQKAFEGVAEGQPVPENTILAIFARNSDGTRGEELVRWAVTDHGARVIDENVIGAPKNALWKFGGSYLLAELSAPSGYLPAGPLSFRLLPAGGDGTLVEWIGAAPSQADAKLDENGALTLVNHKRKTVDAVVNKRWRDAEDNPIVSGTPDVTVTLMQNGVPYASADATRTLTAASGYTYRWSGLPAEAENGAAAEYSVRESAVPGYEPGDPLVTRDGDGNFLIELVNRQSAAEIWISKRDATGMNELAGAELTLREAESGNVVDQWTSLAGESRRVRVTVGKAYILSEAAPPAGYLPAAGDVEFTVRLDAKGQASIAITEGGLLAEASGNEMAIKDAPFSILVEKRFAGSGETASTTLEILDETGGTVLETLSGVTNGTPVALDADKKYLKAGGTYLLREPSAPDGYVRASDIAFTVDENGMAHYAGAPTPKDTVVMHNELVSFSVLKADGEGDAPLAGAELLLEKRGVDGESWTAVEAWSSAQVNPKSFQGLTGTFRLSETSAPEGYAMAEPLQFTVGTGADGQPSYALIGGNGRLDGDTFVMSDERIADLSLQKADAKGGPVAGAQLELWDRTTGALVDAWVSGREAHAVNGGKLCALHDYEWLETSVPAGYLPAEPVAFTIDEEGRVVRDGIPSDDREIVMVDLPFSVVLEKTDGNAPLAGATLALYAGVAAEGAQPLETWVSDGTAWTVGAGMLQFGQSYTIRELSAPTGYAYADDLVFTVTHETLSGENADTDPETGAARLRLAMEDRRITTSFAKLNADEGNAPLAGATLTLYQRLSDGREERVASWTTADAASGDPRNPYTVEGLEPGATYILRETGVPDGFRQAADLVFTVQRDGSLKDEEGRPTPNRVEMLNSGTDKTALTVEKIWIDHEPSVPVEHGPILVQLQRKLESEPETSWQDMPGRQAALTGAEGWRTTFGNLPLTDASGINRFVYRAREVDAPEGYTTTAETSDGKTTITNRRDTLEAFVGKRDITGTEELAGAELVLRDAAGLEADRWTSAAEPHRLAIELTLGEIYTLEETIAPAGYARTENVKFLVGEDADGKPEFTILSGTGMVDGNGVIVMRDEPLDVSVLKVGPDGAPLAGAVLELYEGEGIGGRRIAAWKSSERAERVLALAEDPGYRFMRGQRYTLHEKTPPAGYAAAEDVVFTFSQDEGVAVQSVTMTDLPMDLVISKLNLSGSSSLAGAVLELYSAPASAGKAPIATHTSDGTPWRVGFSSGLKLMYGQSYVIREAVPPAGYVRAADITVTLDADTLKAASAENGGLVLSLYREVRDEETGVSILKQDAQTGMALAGAELELYHVRADGARERMEAWTSGSAAHELTGTLTVGETYLVKEVKAPAGYGLSNEYRFVMKDGYTSASPLRIIMKDDHVYRFRKQNSRTGGVVVGATLGVYDNATGALVESWKTGNTEYHEMLGTLEAGKTYVLREIVTPAGFLTAEPVTFAVNAQGRLVLGASPAAANSVDMIVMMDEPVPEATPTPLPDNLDLTVTKRWEDADNTLGKRPSKITLYLYRKLATQGSYPAEPYMTVDVRPQDVNSNAWRFTFYDLEWYNGNGVEYSYLVREQEVPGYNVRYGNNGRTIINALPEEDIPPTPTPTLPNVTPTPAPTETAPVGVRFVDGDWVYIDENGVPLGLVPQTGDDTDWLLWGVAIALPLLMAAIAAVEIRRRKKQAALRAHRNNG